MRKTRKLPHRRLRALLSAVVIAAAALTAGAETVAQKQAAHMAQLFFNEANGRVVPSPRLVWNGRNLTTNRLFIPFYVYNNPAGGFVIISAENKAFPILGYSLKDSFDPDRLGDAARALLRSYARDIEMVRYDSRVPEEAIAAWGDYPTYVSTLLKAPCEVTDPKFDIEESGRRIESAIRSGVAEETASDIYTPKQWQELIGEELRSSHTVALGLVDRGSVRPAIVHGSKGAYFRMALDGRNQWLVRLLPTEILSGSQIADFTYPKPIALPEEEDTAYRLYDDFAAETRAEHDAREAAVALDRLPAQDGPVVEGIGGGHYAITLPENVVSMTIYNLAGNLCEIRTFKSTDTAFADLSIEPSGFYFALLRGASGRTYGVKLVR